MRTVIGAPLDLRRPCRALAAAGVVAALCTGVPAAAGDSHLSLEFEAYIGGISALTVGVEAGLRPDAYAVDFRFGTRGVASWLVDWSMKSYSRGAFDEGRMIPASAGADSLWNGRKRSTRLDYSGDGSVSVDLVPAARDDDREHVSEEHKRGTTDLSSALLATLAIVGRQGKCDNRAKVYDGRRRYDLMFEDGGKGLIGPDAPSVFHGPTIRCKLWIEPVAGFRRTQSRLDWATGDEAVIHVAQVFDGAPPVPVALEYDTGIGLLRAYLIEATFLSGGEQQRLATNRAGETSKIGTGGGAKPAQ